MDIGFLCSEEWEHIDDNYCVMNNDSLTDSVYSWEQQELLLEIEDDSWWHKYRDNVIQVMMEQFFMQSLITVDLGGGNGYNSYTLQKNGYDVVLVEPSKAGCVNAKNRGVKRICCGTFSRSSIREKSVDQILLLDVLEHVEDDKDFLATIFERLKPGGRIILTVPAFMCLYSSTDRLGGHYRRYKIGDLILNANMIGFKVIYASYYFQFLFAPILIFKVFFEKIGVLKTANERSTIEDRKIRRSQFKNRSGIVGIVLKLAEKRELKKLKKHKTISFGSSIIMILER